MIRLSYQTALEEQNMTGGVRTWHIVLITVLISGVVAGVTFMAVGMHGPCAEQWPVALVVFFVFSGFMWLYYRFVLGRYRNSNKSVRSGSVSGYFDGSAQHEQSKQSKQIARSDE